MICQICKKEYKPKYRYAKSYLAKRKYCSRECYLQDKQPTWFQKGHDLSKGIKNPAYKNGQHFKYELWRKAVFERDDYTCNKCGTKGHYLNAHHIKEQSLYIELKYTLDNGITLCRPCHQQWHKEKGIINQFSEPWVCARKLGMV